MLQILTCFLNQMVSPEPLMAVQTFSHRVLEVLNMTRCFQDGFWHQIRGIHFCEIISSDKGIFPHPCNHISDLLPHVAKDYDASRSAVRLIGSPKESSSHCKLHN